MSGLLGDAANYYLSNYPALITILNSHKELCRKMFIPNTHISPKCPNSSNLPTFLITMFIIYHHSVKFKNWHYRINSS